MTFTSYRRYGRLALLNKAKKQSWGISIEKGKSHHPAFDAFLNRETEEECQQLLVFDDQAMIFDLLKEYRCLYGASCKEDVRSSAALFSPDEFDYGRLKKNLKTKMLKNGNLTDEEMNKFKNKIIISLLEKSPDSRTIMGKNGSRANKKKI